MVDPSIKVVMSYFFDSPQGKALLQRQRGRLRLQDPKVQELREETRDNRWHVRVKEVSRDYQMQLNDEMVLINTTDRAVDVTLPPLSTVREGRVYMVKESRGGNVARMVVTSGDIINVSDTARVTTIASGEAVVRFTHQDARGARWHTVWSS